jgi:hypothetical protein
MQTNIYKVKTFSLSNTEETGVQNGSKRLYTSSTLYPYNHIAYTLCPTHISENVAYEDRRYILDSRQGTLSTPQ